MYSKRSFKIVLIFFTVLFCSCDGGNVEREEVIGACAGNTDRNDNCVSCCQANGFDTGQIDGFDNECVCIDYADN